MADDEPNARLGKIERFLLYYMVEPFPYAWQLHSRSCVLQAYYRQINNLSLRQRRVVSRVIPPKEYASLQVRFTRAMQGLEKKGLIEMFRVRPSRHFGDRGRGPEPAELISGRLYIGDQEVKPHYNHVCCRRRRPVVYRLTRDGRDTALSVQSRVWQEVINPRQEKLFSELLSEFERRIGDATED